jgi:hypothetical protein
MAFSLLLAVPNERPLGISALVTQLGRYQNGGEIHSSILTQLPPDRNWKHILLCHPAILEAVVRFCRQSVFWSSGIIFNFQFELVKSIAYLNMKSTLSFVAAALLGAGLTGATPLMHDSMTFESVPEQAAVAPRKAEHVVRDLDVQEVDAAQGLLCLSPCVWNFVTDNWSQSV